MLSNVQHHSVWLRVGSDDRDALVARQENAEDTIESGNERDSKLTRILEKKSIFITILFSIHAITYRLQSSHLIHVHPISLMNI